ncbi:uncharacterized protein FYW47_002418 [Aplochiton taeniatus]
MELTVWMCVLCLQASLLSQALDCSGTAPGTDCVTEQSDGDQGLGRQRRQLERRGPTHLSRSSLPGSVSVKGFPNSLILAERARRHLGQTGSKKKKSRKSRVGSFSLLSNDPTNSLQVTRARRQLKPGMKKGRSENSGAYSVLF